MNDDGHRGPLNSAVLVIAFNRPALTAEVLGAVLEADVRRLYVAVDGPRPGHPDDEAKVDRVCALFDGIPAPTSVRLLRQPANQGCRMGVLSALDWFFSQEEEGIVLEDDCVPSRSFFAYCDSMLNAYRHEERVWMISGLNQLDDWRASQTNYFFSDGGIWGWATWRDRWARYDAGMSGFGSPAVHEQVRAFVGQEWWSVLEEGLSLTAAGLIDTWDYQWTWSRLKNFGLTVLPAKNLVTNVGSGSDATHGGVADAFVHRTRYEIEPSYRPSEPVCMDQAYLRALAGRIRKNKRRLRRQARLRYYSRKFSFAPSQPR